MNHQALQAMLKTSGHYGGALDGVFGPLEATAIMAAMTDGPDTPLNDFDYLEAARKLGLTPPYVKAFAEVESAGAGFAEGRPVILFEPHRFSRATGRAFDARHPDISYPKWDRSKYPRTQGLRYAQLIKAVGLNVDAGFASASYGKFQVLGENFALCGYRTSAEFALGQARDEKQQLRAFMNFADAKGLVPLLKAGEWDEVAERYNGTGAALNNYGDRLRSAFIRAGGR